MAGGTPGPNKKVDPEALFDVFYNNGQRRTYAEVEAFTKREQIGGPNGVSYATVRRYADEFDWTPRADAIDAETRTIRDKRLAHLVATHRAREIEIIATITNKFFRRAIPSTAEHPNPAEIRPEDIEIGDFIALAKTFELLTGGATERVGDEGPSRLDEMERAIREMDALEQAAITTGGK
jgi:hypothetical protein